MRADSCGYGTTLRRNVVTIGTVGKSEMINRLVAAKKIDISGIPGKWEPYFTQVVRGNRFGAGLWSDKRGTIYGVYDLSEESGQSPWYYWADVPVKKPAELTSRLDESWPASLW